MTDRLQEVREFVQAVDADLQRTFDFEVEEVRESGDPGASYYVKGHAAVFNKWSLDLGGFRERIKKGAFTEVLSRDPHVLHVIDHDTRWVLSSTRNSTLELREDPQGLHYWSKVAPTSYAADLRILLERGDISQSSFAFIPGKDEWRIKEDDNGEEIIERDIIEIKQLFDVTTCAMGAYPTTDSALAVRSMVSGRHQGPVLAADYDPAFRITVPDEEKEVAPDSEDTPRASNEDAVAQRAAIAQLKSYAASETQRARERLFRGKEF